MTVLPTRIEIEAERCRRNYRHFVKAVWDQVEPATPFVSNWHIDALCEYLEAVVRGEVRRLLVNIPPRSGKTLLGSVLLAPWTWATTPERRFLYASYHLPLAEEHSRLSRGLIQSRWYEERFGGRFTLADDQNQAGRFSNDKTGVRATTSIGGAATGQGGDIIVVDDPHELSDARSTAKREAAIAWFSTTMATRLNDPRSGAYVVIGQRVHQNDLSGVLLEEGGWEVLCLPAEYEPKHQFMYPADPRTTPGELLWPQRLPRAELAAIKRRLGSYNAAAQLQQSPSPAQGGVFNRSWWRWYDPAGPLPDFDKIVLSFDLAFTGRETSDFVVGQAWGQRGAHRYLLRQIRDRLNVTQTLAAVEALSDQLRHTFPDSRVGPVLIEAAANGHAVTELLHERVPGILLVTPKGDKVARAQAVTPDIEAGQVFLAGAPNHDKTSYDPAHTPVWVQAFVEETAAFPRSTHDDQVDAMTQALRWMAGARRRPRVRRVR